MKPALERRARGALFQDSIRALSGCVLSGFDLLPALAAQDADETAHRVLLPARDFHDLGQSRAFGALHHGDHLRLVVGARFGCAFLRPHRREALVGELLERVRCVPTGVVAGASSGDKRWTVVGNYLGPCRSKKAQITAGPFGPLGVGPKIRGARQYG
jgi:hypothetical protein